VPVAKIAFSIGSFEIAWYGVFLAVGFLAGFWTASRRAARQGIAAETVFDLGPWLLLGALIGARSLYVVEYWHESFEGGSWWQIFNVRSGLVYYGGFIGAALAGFAYAHWKKLPAWKLADVMAPSIALGSVFGRVGCLMTGCCYGRPTDLPWGIEFPPGHETYPHHVHPTQIYDSLLNLCLYAGLAWLFRRKKFDGQVFAAYLICYAFTRSITEAFRGDYPVYYFGGVITPAHLVSVGILVAGLFLWRFLSSRKAGAPDTLARDGKP